MDKNSLRKEMKALREAMQTNIKAEEDNSIFSELINSQFYKAAKIIMIYVSFGHETDTLSIIRHGLANNKCICVPKVINKKEGMKAICIENLDELKESRLGILEPDHFEKEIYVGDIDLFVVPGLAFDMNGGRMGYGAGFYDRFLMNARKDALKIGLAYSFQIVKAVPMDKNDIPMDMIISGEHIG